jgi:hypothetical protein
LRNPPGNAVGCRPGRIVGEVRIAGRRLRVAMSEQLADGE